jgi:hypothetical protein
MSIYELDISWATTASERRRLQWQLIVSEEVCGVFLTARDDVLAVLFSGDQEGFAALARALAPKTLGTAQ